MEDPYREMPAGLTGIVDSVDDLGKFIAIGRMVLRWRLFRALTIFIRI